MFKTWQVCCPPLQNSSFLHLSTPWDLVLIEIVPWIKPSCLFTRKKKPAGASDTCLFPCLPDAIHLDWLLRNGLVQILWDYQIQMVLVDSSPQNGSDTVKSSMQDTPCWAPQVFIPPSHKPNLDLLENTSHLEQSKTLQGFGCSGSTYSKRLVLNVGLRMSLYSDLNFLFRNCGTQHSSLLGFDSSDSWGSCVVQDWSHPPCWNIRQVRNAYGEI